MILRQAQDGAPGAPADANAKPVFNEIATIGGGRDITRGFIPWDLLTPQDRVLQARGFDYRLYEFVLGDEQVMSTFQQRRLAVVAREWEVTPGGTGALDVKAADSLREQLQAAKWDNATDKMLSGVFYGYAIAEMLWATDGAEIVIDAIKVRNRRRFKFGVDQRPKLITFERPLGEELPERKFWTFATGADNDDEPYGLGLAYWLYWPVFFKRNDIKLWLIFLDKFGQPTARTSYEPGASAAEINRALAAAAAIATETAIAIPKNMELELIEAARSGTPDYVTLHDKMNAAISKVVLSQTMTTDDGSSLAQGQVHEGVKKEVVASDAALVCDSFNRGPARWLTEWNFPGARTPIVSRKMEDAPDLGALATRDKTIYDMGFSPTEDYIRQTYGEGWIKRDMTPPPALLPPGSGLPAEFAARDPRGSGRAIVDDFAARLADEASPRIQAMVVKVRALLDQSGSLEEAREKLIALYPDLGTKDFAEVMTRALVATDLAGRSEVDSE
jgi:phage gp29-like protein